MYTVTLFDKENNCKVAEFDEKDKAIRYFNHVCDRMFIYSLDCERVEIADGKTILFDYWR